MREDRDLGLREFARMLGVSRTYVYKVEKDLLVPNPERCFQIARLLGELPTEVLATAGWAPDDVVALLCERPDLVDLVRLAGSLPADELAWLVWRLRKGKR